MNPASRIWDIPPPPGTEDIELEEVNSPTDVPEPESDKEESEEKETPPTEEDEKPPIDRPIDRINPYLKNPEYIEYEKRHLERRRRSRSRSHSREKHRRRRYSRSRSRSRDRYRRSRSRSRRRRRRYSSSRSRSRSPSHRRRRYAKRRSRSSSRYSRSRSRSRQHVRISRSHKDKKSPPSRKSSSNEREKAPLDADINEVDMKIEEEEEDQTKDNVFKNDGTFLEMFKKMQEQQQKVQVQENPAPAPVKKPFPAFGKRRGGKVLKTGMVQKLKQQTEEEATSQDAWSVYMKEVRKYKEACCDDDSKTRPLVK